MALVSEKPCWEIMRCPEDAVCVARKHPERPCWEHAEALNYTASVHGVCVDCIVYVVKQKPQHFSEREISKILGHQKVYGVNHPKCPAQSINARLWPMASERRESARYRIKGKAQAVIANRDNSIGCVLDLSHKGLAFSYNGHGSWLDQPLHMEIRGDNFAVTGLPAQIISDRPNPDSAQEHRRCGVRFTSLSLLQQDMLETIIRQYGQEASPDRIFC